MTVPAAATMHYNANVHLSVLPCMQHTTLLDLTLSSTYTAGLATQLHMDFENKYTCTHKLISAL